MKHRRGRGEGSISQRPDGRWCARLQVGGRRQAVYGATKDGVLGKLSRLRLDVADGMPIVADKSTVAEYLTRWLEDFVRPSLRRPTYLIYEGVIRVHIRPRIGSIRLSKLRDTDIQRMLAEMDRDNVSARRRQQAYGLMRTALKQARRTGLIRYNPCEGVDKPRWQPPAARFLSAAQVGQLLEVMRTDRYWPLYALAIATGLREGELLALWWEDINLGNRTLAVTRSMSQDKNGQIARGEPKTTSSRRVVDLPKMAIDALSQQKQALFAEGMRDEQKYPWVFCTADGSPLQKDVVLRRFKRALRTADLPDMTFHGLRHTAASLRLAQGAHPKVVQEMLGHSSISTTFDIYGHVVPSLQRESADRLDQLFPGNVMAH